MVGRKQYVSVEGCDSGLAAVTSGVPQGSLLGPVLFVIYINDMTKVVKHSKIKLYADDAKIYFSYDKDESVDAFLSDISSVYEWAINMQLSVALQKCSVLNIGRQSDMSDVNINGVSIPSVSSMRDLGVIISCNLKFGQHYETISKRALVLVNLIF